MLSRGLVGDHPADQSSEIGILAPVSVYPETKLIEVSLQILIAYFVEYAPNPAFQLLNKPMNGLKILGGITFRLSDAP